MSAATVIGGLLCLGTVSLISLVIISGVNLDHYNSLSTTVNTQAATLLTQSASLAVLTAKLEAQNLIQLGSSTCLTDLQEYSDFVRRIEKVEYGMQLAISNPDVPSEIGYTTGSILEIEVYSYFDGGCGEEGVGDLCGVTLKLPYIEDLGFSGILLTQPTQGLNDFGMDVINQKRIQPELGNNTNAFDLLCAAHDLGLLVNFGFVTHAVSVQHPYFQSVLDGNETYLDYFLLVENATTLVDDVWRLISDVFPNSTLAETSPFLYFRESVPYGETPISVDLNLESPQVLADKVDEVLYWATRGVDGFYLHSLSHIMRANSTTSGVRALQEYAYRFHELLVEQTRLVVPGLHFYARHKLNNPNLRTLGGQSIEWETDFINAYFGIRDANRNEEKSELFLRRLVTGNRFVENYVSRVIPQTKQMSNTRTLGTSNDARLKALNIQLRLVPSYSGSYTAGSEVVRLHIPTVMNECNTISINGRYQYNSSTSEYTFAGTFNDAEVSDAFVGNGTDAYGRYIDIDPSVLWDPAENAEEDMWTDVVGPLYPDNYITLDFYCPSNGINSYIVIGHPDQYTWLFGDSYTAGEGDLFVQIFDPDDVEKVRILLSATLPGTPHYFQGAEIGMLGDGMEVREPVIWDDGPNVTHFNPHNMRTDDSYIEEFTSTTNTALTVTPPSEQLEDMDSQLTLCRNITRYRRDSPTLRRGVMTWIPVTELPNYAYYGEDFMTDIEYPDNPYTINELLVFRREGALPIIVIINMGTRKELNLATSTFLKLLGTDPDVIDKNFFAQSLDIEVVAAVNVEHEYSSYYFYGSATITMESASGIVIALADGGKYAL